MRYLIFLSTLICSFLSHAAYGVNPHATLTVAISSEALSPQFDIIIHSVEKGDKSKILKIITQKTNGKISKQEAISNFKRIGGVEGYADILLVPVAFEVKYDGKCHSVKGDVVFSNSMIPTEPLIYLSDTEKDVEIGFN